MQANLVYQSEYALNIWLLHVPIRTKQKVGFPADNFLFNSKSSSHPILPGF